MCIYVHNCAVGETDYTKWGTPVLDKILSIKNGGTQISLVWHKNEDEKLCHWIGFFEGDHLGYLVPSFSRIGLDFNGIGKVVTF